MRGDAIDRELDKMAWPLTRAHARAVLERAMDARVTELLEANNREVDRRRRAESAEGVAQQLRAARLLKAATEDAQMLLKAFPNDAGLNLKMAAAQVLTNINHALHAALMAGISRARDLDGND